ncbi:MAG TPA: hypothetical protein VM509_02540 [Planctomycetota bacterium]|nr:hypothetical protein [Planctomycetota bacterium]
MRLAATFLAASLALCALVSHVHAAVPVQAVPTKGLHEDARYGFKFRAPKDFTRIPLKLEEQWQVAKYLSERKYFYTDPDLGWTTDHQVTATVIAFVSEKVREEATARKKKDEKDTDRYVILISNPYKDYLDYMKRTYDGGGWYKSAETQAKIDGVDVTQYEIKVEKLTRDGPKRVICWVFHTPEVDFAFSWEMLESAYPKLKDFVNDTLRSFKLIPRTEAGLPSATTGEERIIDLEDAAKQTPEERKARRIQLEQSLHGKAKSSMAPGWQALQIGRFLVLNHTDEKYARRVAEHSEAVMGWLDQTFPFVGPDEYVRAPILRICKNYDEENAFHSGGGMFYFFGDNQIEIVVSQDDEGFVTGNAVERVNRQLLQLWFFERDRDVSSAMPFWLTGGLSQVIGTARAKGSKLEFRADDWERDGVRERIREGKMTKVRDLLKMGAEDYTSSAEGYFGRQKEAGSLVRFFVTGPASKNAKTKDVLRDYLKNLKSTIVEIKEADKAKDGKSTKAPANEKEEEEQFKASSQKWKQKEKELLDSAFEKSFHGWGEKEWEAFESAYLKTIS